MRSGTIGRDQSYGLAAAQRGPRLDRRPLCSPRIAAQRSFPADLWSPPARIEP